MTRKQLDQTREVRLWIGQIIVPAVTLAATTLAIQEGGGLTGPLSFRAKYIYLYEKHFLKGEVP